MTRNLQAGDVIAEVDHRGGFVDLWVVAVVNVHAPSGTIRPYKVRRACRSRAAVEEWSGFAWRFSVLAHRFQAPPEGR